MRLIALAASALVLVSSATLAHGSKDPVKAQIEYRQALYKMVGASMGKMGAVMKGKAEYNAETITKAANVMAALAPVANEGFELKSVSEDSEAKAVIWEQKDKFDEKMAAFVTATAKLAENAGTEEGFKSNFGPVGKSCKGCHDDFKED